MIRKKLKVLLGPKITKSVVQIRDAVYNAVSGLFPMQREIILESHPDFTCNTFELYRYMIKQGVNKDHRITWITDGSSELKEMAENVGFLDFNPKGFKDRLRFYIHCNRASVCITSNRHLSKKRMSKKQVNVYLDHGSQLKSLLNEDGSRKELWCDYMICQSEFFVPYNVEQYTLRKDQVICTGLPRNDQLFRKYDSIHRLLGNRSDYGKVIIWVPTFRQHMDNVRIDCSHDYPLGLSILNSEEDALRLNETLKDKNVLLIIKPHPAQSLDVIKSFDLSNIVFIYNSDLAAQDIQTNELLAQTDAMITDYSSIYYDYLLLHRPIAITLDDFDDYNRDKGFVFDDPLEVLKGAYIYDLNDFCAFVADVANGIDRAKEDREEICDKLHTFQDDKSSMRVFEFIMKEEKKRFG